MTYRRRPTPLHAARAAVGCAYCGALGLAVLLLDHPLALGALLALVLAAGAGAQSGRALVRSLRWAIPFGLAVALVNMLVTSDGLTVIARLGSLPVRGRLDVTLEATVYGAVLGLRAIVLVLVFALYSVAVDPDEVLRLFRRVSYRSALTATLATRLVPVLRRDAGRLAEAQRARPGPSPSRFALLRAVSAGALDRAVDVAAALEVRGYGGAGAPARIRRPWSRHDFAFALAAAAIAGGALAARYGGLLSFDAYPRLHAPLRAGGLVVLAAIAICTLAPFGDRRGVRR